MQEREKIGQNRLGIGLNFRTHLRFEIAQCVVDILFAINIAGLFRSQLCFKLAQFTLNLSFFERGIGRVQKRHERELPVLRENQTDHTKRCTAQSKRVFRAGWLFVNRPETDQRVELVSQSDSNSNRVLRHKIRWALRLVMLFESRSDGFVFALKQRIFAAHGTLEFRELADNFRGQIGLSQNCRTGCKRRISTDQRCNLACQFADAFNACALRA